MYKIKALIRWLRFSLRVGVSYHHYGSGEDCGQFVGYYQARGKCIAFRNEDGTIHFGAGNEAYF